MLSSSASGTAWLGAARGLWTLPPGPGSYDTPFGGRGEAVQVGAGEFQAALETSPTPDEKMGKKIS
jgi:hypothetical protein